MSVKHFAIQLLIAAVGCSSIYGDDSAQHGRTYAEHHHSSTYEESVLYGTGKLLRDMGAGFKDMSEGHKALAQAQAQYIANRSANFHYQLERQQLLAELRAAKRDKPATLEQMTRWAKAMAPQRLTPDELTSDGTVNWPTVLLDPRHATTREAIQLALKHLAVEPDRGRVIRIRRSCVAGCDRMKDELHAQIREYPPHDYVWACNFIKSLRVEVQHWGSPIPRERIAIR